MFNNIFGNIKQVVRHILTSSGATWLVSQKEIVAKLKVIYFVLSETSQEFTSETCFMKGGGQRLTLLMENVFFKHLLTNYDPVVLMVVLFFRHLAFLLVVFFWYFFQENYDSKLP